MSKTKTETKQNPGTYPYPLRLRRGMGWCLWHSVNVELPDDDMTVLIALSDGEVWTGFMDAGDWRYVSAELVDQGSGTKVTHWAEFPEPPNAMVVAGQNYPP